MKRFKFNKKAAALGLAVGLAVGAGGVAFAYFTATGTGTGTGHVTSAANAFTVTVATPSGPALAPTPVGDANQQVETFTYSIVNTGESYSYLTTVTIKVTSGGAAGCSASWFSITGQTGAGRTTKVIHPDVKQPSASDTPTPYTNSFTLQLVTNTATQDACKGASPVVTVKAS